MEHNRTPPLPDEVGHSVEDFMRLLEWCGEVLAANGGARRLTTLAHALDMELIDRQPSGGAGYWNLVTRAMQSGAVRYLASKRGLEALPQGALPK